MKPIVLGVALLGLSSGLWAQSPAVPSVRGAATVPAAVQEAPASNIDLLRKTLSTSQVAAPSSAPAVPIAVQTAPVAPKPISANDNMLEMPLDIGSGQVVKTQVSKPVVVPKKTVSAKAAQRVAASNVKRTQAARQQLRSKPTPVEKDLEQSNALLPVPLEGERTEMPSADAEDVTSEDAAAAAELEYAARMLQESKESAQSGRKIPPSAAKNTTRTVPAPNKVFNPNEFRPGVTWQKSDSTHFTIYTQKRENGISSSNMAMTFESAYQTLRRFIPWMMSGNVRVFVYQDYQSYLKHEPQAKAWTRALAYPTRGEIVVYDEPGKVQELKEIFTHELTHIFTQQFFDQHKSGRIMTPTWLDEGIAVLMEDQAYNGMKGGPWNNDLKTLNFQRDPSTAVAEFGSKSLFGASRRFTAKSSGKPLYFAPFGSFMQPASLASFEGQDKVQDWYFQAYAMVRFLLNPAGGSTPSNRMQFEQFTRLLAQGEPVRNAAGFLVKDKQGRPIYQPYSEEKAMGRAFRYSNAANFEDNFWRWAQTVKGR